MVKAAPEVVVVGGGMAGLAAALRLRDLGLSPLLLESSGRTGGPVGSERFGEWLVETGPTFLPPPGQELSALLDRNGVVLDRIAPAARQRRHLRTANGIFPVPESTSELVSSPLLSLAGRMRLLREPFIERGGHGTETVREFGERRYGREMTRQFLEPAVAASTGGDPVALLAEAVIPQQVDAERTAGSILRGRLRAARERRRSAVPAESPWGLLTGMGSLPDAIAASLGDTIRFGRTVTSIVPAGGRCDVHCSDGSVTSAGAVVLALPGPSVAPLLGRFQGLTGVAEAVRGMAHLDAVSLWLGFPAGAFPPIEGVAVIPGSDFRSPVISVGLHAGSIAGRTPTGGTLASVLLGGVDGREVMAMPVPGMIEAVRELLAPIGQWRSEPEMLGMRRWPGALPQFDVAHPAVERAVAAAGTRVPAVAFCGSWLNGGSVVQVMTGGVAAADRVAEALRAVSS